MAVPDVTTPRAISPPLRAYAGVAILLASCGLASCGDRFSVADIDEMSRSLSEVMIAVQRGTDSSARSAIADSVARSHGYSDWGDLRTTVGEVATEPDRLRMLLDSTQKRIEEESRPTTSTTNDNGGSP